MREKYINKLFQKALIYCLLIFVCVAIFGLLVSVVDLWGISRLTGRYQRQHSLLNLVINMKLWTMFGAIQAATSFIAALGLGLLRCPFTIRRVLSVAAVMPIVDFISLTFLALLSRRGVRLTWIFGSKGLIICSIIVAFLVSVLFLVFPKKHRDMLPSVV